MSSEDGKVSIKVLVKDKRFREYRMDKKLEKEKSSLCQTKYEVTRRISEIIKDKTTKIRELEQAVKRLRKGRDCWTDIAIAVNPSNEDFFLDVVRASEKDLAVFEKDNFFTTEKWAKLKKISELSDGELQKLRSVAEKVKENDSEEKINHMEWIRQTTTAGTQKDSANSSSTSVSTDCVPTANENLQKKENVFNTANSAVKDIKCNGNYLENETAIGMLVKPDKKNEKGNETSPEQEPVANQDVTSNGGPVDPVITTPSVSNAQSNIAPTKDLKQNGSGMIISEKMPRKDDLKSDVPRENSRNLQINNGNISSKPNSISKMIESSQATTLSPSQVIEKTNSETATGKFHAVETKQDPPKTNVKPTASVLKSVETASTTAAQSSIPKKDNSAQPASTPILPKAAVMSPAGTASMIPTTELLTAQQKKEHVEDTTSVKTTENKIPAVKKSDEEVNGSNSGSFAKQLEPSKTTAKSREMKKLASIPSAAPVAKDFAPAQTVIPLSQPPVQVKNGLLNSESVEFPKLTDPPPKVEKKRLTNPNNMPRLRFSGADTIAPVPVVVPIQHPVNNVWLQRKQEREMNELMRFNVPPPPYVPVVPQPPRFSSTPLNPNAEPFKPMFQRNQETLNSEKSSAGNQNEHVKVANGHGKSGRKESYKKDYSKKEPVKREPVKTVDSDGWITIAKKPAQGPSGKQPKEHKYYEPNNSPRTPKPALVATASPLKQATTVVAQPIVPVKQEPVSAPTFVSKSFAKVATNATVPSSASAPSAQAKLADKKPTAPVVKAWETSPQTTVQSSGPTESVSAEHVSSSALPKPAEMSPAGASSATPANDNSPKLPPASANGPSSSNTSGDDEIRPKSPRSAVTPSVCAPTVPEPAKQSSGSSGTRSGEPVQQYQEPRKAQHVQTNRRSKAKKGKGKKESNGMSHEEIIALAKKKKEEEQTRAFRETQQAYNEIRQEREKEHNLRRYNAQNADTIASYERCHANLKKHTQTQAFQYRLLGSRLFTTERLKELSREESGISLDKIQYLRKGEQRLAVVDHMCSFIMFMKKNFDEEDKQFPLIDLARYLESTSFREKSTFLNPETNAKIELEYTQFLRNIPRAVKVSHLSDYMTSAGNFVKALDYVENLQRRLKEELKSKDGNNPHTAHIHYVFNVFEDMHSHSSHFVNKTSYLQSQSKTKNFILEEDLLLVMENKISPDEIIGTEHVELADTEMEWSDCDGPYYAKRPMNGSTSDVQVNGKSTKKATENTGKIMKSNGAEIEKSESEDGEKDIETADNSCQTEEEFSGQQEEPASSLAVKN